MNISKWTKTGIKPKINLFSQTEISLIINAKPVKTQIISKFLLFCLKFDLDDAPNDKIDKSHIERIKTQEGHKNNVRFSSSLP